MPASLIADPFQVRELVILRLDDLAKGRSLLSHATSHAPSQKAWLYRTRHLRLFTPRLSYLTAGDTAYGEISNF